MKINSASLKKQRKVVSSRFVSSHTRTCRTCIGWLVTHPTTSMTSTSLAHAHYCYAHVHNTVNKHIALIEWSCVHLHWAMDDQTFMRMCTCIILLLMHYLVSTCSVSRSHIYRFFPYYVRTANILYGVEEAIRSSRLLGPRRYTRCCSNSNYMVWKLVSFPTQKSHVLDSFPHFAACRHSFDSETSLLVD